jgi:hypothetical protein
MAMDIAVCTRTSNCPMAEKMMVITQILTGGSRNKFLMLQLMTASPFLRLTKYFPHLLGHQKLLKITHL